MLNANIRKYELEKNCCFGERQQKDLSRFKAAIHQIMPLILVLIASILNPFATIYAQPTGNLEAKYYAAHNRYTNFDTFGGTVIETRTWDKIYTRDYNPQGRRDMWSVDIQGYIYIPSNGTYSFRTASDDGVRLKVDDKIVINNWTNHAPRWDYGSVSLQSGWKPIRLQMYEWGGGTMLRLYWKVPGSISWVFPPAANLSTSLPDTTAPTLSSVSIASDNTTNTLANPGDDVTITFTASEAIDTPVVTFKSGGAAVTDSSVVYSNTTGNTWTAVYTANANDTAGTVSYSIAFSDTAGNAGTAVTATNDSSSVAVVIDSDLPTLLSSSPSNGSKSAKLDQNIILKFSEDIIAGSGQIKLFDSSDQLVEAFTLSPSIISGSTVTLNPSSDLASGSAYYIQIPSTAFVDTAGNGFAGISNKTTLNFITLDVNSPYLISSTPSDNAASVKLDQNIVLNFNEAVTAGSGKIKLFDGKDQLVEAFNVSSSIISGATVTLNPTADLKPDNSYYIQIPSTAFTDAAGNSYAGINNKTAINFTTRKKTPKEAFTEVKGDIGTDMKSNTTKQIRSFATATTAVVTAARGRVLSKRVNSSSSRNANRSSSATRSSGGGGSGPAVTGGSSGNGSNPSGNGSDGVGSENSGGNDTDSSFDLRSSTRGTNASGSINGVTKSYDGKATRYTESQFSYTKSKNKTKTGNISGQVIFEREKSDDLTVGHFLGFSMSQNSTIDLNTTEINSTGLQFGIYLVKNITDDLFVDAYLAGSLLTNKMEVITPSMTAEADYLSRMGATGAALTGSLYLDRWEILPTVALDYSLVSSKDASFEVTSGGGNSNELSSPGKVKQLSLTFSPDFRTSFGYYQGLWAQGSTFSLKPKVTCQRIEQDTITKECGQGAALSVISQDESALKTFSFTLGIDKISDDTTFLANALYKVEF